MGSANRWNRRQWVSAAATAVGAATVLPSRSWGSLAGMFGNAAPRPVHEAVDTMLKAFPLSQVRLRPGIFLDQMESNQSFIESLPNDRSEEHTSELQSLRHLVCRLLLEKKKLYNTN